MNELTNAITDCYNANDNLQLDDLINAFRIGSRCMIEEYGVRKTVAFLKQKKGKSLDEIIGYVTRGIEKAGFNWRDCIERPAPIPSAIETETHGENNTVTIAPTIQTEVIDEDPHRFTLTNIIRLSFKLKSHEFWDELLETENNYLKSKSKGSIDARVVAFIGCLWRKNLRTSKPAIETGAVAFDACTDFFRRDTTMLPKAPDNLQIAAALRILEGVEFLKRCREGIDRNRAIKLGVKPRCATYKLRNEDKWE